MSSLNVIRSRYSSSGDGSISRPDFKIYAQVDTGGLGGSMDAAGFARLKTQGIGLLWNFYNISSGPYNNTNATTWATLAYPSATYVVRDMGVNLWFANVEDAYYSFGVSDASTCIADTASLTSAVRASIAALSPPQSGAIGAYTGAAAGLKEPGSYLFKQYTLASQQSVQADNDACGQYVASYWDFAVPECYATSMDQVAGRLDWLSAEKARLGLSIKLLPLVWPYRSSVSLDYDFITSVLEYAIRKPEIDGIAFWAISSNTYTAPNYLDSEPWMAATLDFIAKYGLTIGTPF